MADANALLLMASLRVVGICAVAWLVTRTLRRLSASARYLVWTCAIAAALSTPLLQQVPASVALPAALAPWTPSPSADASALPSASEAAAIVQRLMPGDAIAADAERSSRITFTSAVTLLWAAGAGLGLVWVGSGVIATARLRRTGSRSTARWTEEARAVAGGMGVRRVTFLESADGSMPYVCGILRPLVVMPSGASGWPSERLRAVLLHELAHVRRHDCLTQLLARVACSLYWFHPMVWLAAQRLRVERERACDDIVLTSGVRGSDYGRHLVDIARSAVPPMSRFAAGGVAMAHRPRLEERLAFILDPRVLRTSSLSARLVVTLFGLLALGGASLHVEAQAPAPPPASAQRPAAGTVTFEVASIRRNKEVEAQRATIDRNVPTVPGRAQTRPGGVLLGRGMTVRELIRDAYGYRNRAQGDIEGGPGWIDIERYDVQAKADVTFSASTSMGLPPEAETALRALLAERMRLKIRMETSVRPVYELVLHRQDGRLGPGLVPSQGGCRPFFQREAVNAGLVIDKPKPGEPEPLRPCPLAIAPGIMAAENMTMADWVRILALTPQLNRTVIDRTGLAGGFNITMKDPEAGRPGFVPDLLPPIKPALESQLGLTLRDARAPVEILVIESVERPTEN
jgi:uncharacterized protein (TIGR03435 family)